MNMYFDLVIFIFINQLFKAFKRTTLDSQQHFLNSRHKSTLILWSTSHHQQNNNVTNNIKTNNIKTNSL